METWELVQLAGCATPDAHMDGERWLRNVQDATREAIAYCTEHDAELNVHEVADGSVPVYTRDVWAVFTDVCAWLEDLDGYVDPAADMTDRARVALYLIAERLVTGLAEAEGVPVA